MDVIEKVTKSVENMGACGNFYGHTLGNLIEQLFSPQGIEFVLSHAYPDLETFRQFKKYEMEEKGVYIDCGDVTLTDPKRVFLIGDTRATLNFSQTKASDVRMMYGAKATINASGFSVVNIEKDRMSKATINVSDNAKVLK